MSSGMVIDSGETTPAAETGVGRGAVAADVSRAEAPAADTGVADDATALAAIEALATATASFADTWHRWSSRQAIAAGANVTRLRLLHMVRCHGPQKMADLADSLDVTPRSVTALVDGLEGEGLVRRVDHATDRRVTLVELACDGDRVAAQMLAYRASLATLFADMPEADRATLLRLLTGLRNRMQAEAGSSGHRQESHHD
jgi:DNA-binding MarR family transcriptional regulator